MSEVTLESIAKHCIDRNITGSQIEYMLMAQAEMRRLRRIEAAIITDCGEVDREGAILELRHLVSQGRGYRGWLNAIADELAKGKSKCKLAK